MSDPHQRPFIVIPAEAGIHLTASRCWTLDPGFRRDDECKEGLLPRGPVAWTTALGISRPQMPTSENR
jgi:hypothetical protein